MNELQTLIRKCGKQVEVAEHLGVTPQEIHAWIKRGYMPGRQFYLYRDALSELLKEQGIDIDPRDIP